MSAGGEPETGAMKERRKKPRQVNVWARCAGSGLQAGGVLPKKSRRRPTLPLGLPSSTIGSKELNFRVRDGIGCGLLDITTGNL